MEVDRCPENLTPGHRCTFYLVITHLNYTRVKLKKNSAPPEVNRLLLPFFSRVEQDEYGGKWNE